MAPTAILFDLDGTVWDSFPWYASLLARASGRDTDSLHAELRRGASIVTIARNCKITNGRFTTLCQSSIEMLQLYPGVRDTLEQLNALRIPTAAVTSLPGRIVEPLLGGLRLTALFHNVVHANNCALRKPNPEPLLTSLRELRVAPDKNVFYVGDVKNDAAAAEAAGIRFAWASYGYGDGCPSTSAVRLNSIEEVLSL
jgi:HAD superfamily hydrolase (TIGR01509 family)